MLRSPLVDLSSFYGRFVRLKSVNESGRTIAGVYRSEGFA